MDGFGILRGGILSLGGGLTNICWNFHREMIQFDEHIFQMGGVVKATN